MSCYPSYTYTPTFTPSATPCLAPTYELHRSRITTPATGSLLTTPLFFRSKNQNFDANDIEVELVASPPRFRVYYNNVLVKSYIVAPYTIGAIATLRNLIQTTDPNPYIEMPALAFDIYDLRTTEPDSDGVVESGLGPFARVALTGGQGAPEDASSLASIRTGPTRSIYIVRSIEDNTGADSFPDSSQRIQQWNGTSWISYCNNEQGECPGEGTC